MTLLRKTRLLLICMAMAVSITLAACGGRGAQSGSAGKRVLSFSPAVTRMLLDMGLVDQVVGVTRLCMLPPGLERPRVGDAMSMSSEAILAVRPDVIFTQVDAARFRGVTDIDSHIKVIYLTIESLEDIPAAMLTIGRELGREDAASVKAAEFLRQIEAVSRSVLDLPRTRVVFVMGTDRPTVAAEGTFVSDMIAAAGGVNAGAAIEGRSIWRSTQIEAIIKAQPEVLICQVTPEQQEQAAAYWTRWKDIPAAAAGKVYIVSDPGWSIPGPHLAELLAKMAKMIHPGAVRGPAVPPMPREGGSGS